MKKKLVWSETIIQGGAPLATPLPHPPMVNGPFQRVVLPGDPFTGHAPMRETFYADAKVIAYRLPRTRRTDAKPEKVTIAGGPSTGRACRMASSRRRCSFRSRRPTHRRGSGPGDYAQPVTILAASLWRSPRVPAASFDTTPQAHLEASGRRRHVQGRGPESRHGRRSIQNTSTR